MGLIEELSSLDINDIGSWTRRVKVLMAGLLCLLIIFLGYNYIIKNQIADLKEIQKKEVILLRKF